MARIGKAIELRLKSPRNLWNVLTRKDLLANLFDYLFSYCPDSAYHFLVLALLASIFISIFGTAFALDGQLFPVLNALHHF
jgi:hypothetical protein